MTHMVDWREVFKYNLVYLVYGKPLVGKTRLAVNIADADLKDKRRVTYISSELNNKPLLDKIKPHVTELVEQYDPITLLDWAKRLTVREPTTIIIDSLGGLREYYITNYGTGNLLVDVGRANRLIISLVHTLTERWLLGQLKLVLLSHESPAIRENWFGEDGYPTASLHAIHDASVIVRVVAREVVEGNVVRIERFGRIIEDRYGLIGAGEFRIPDPLF